MPSAYSAETNVTLVANCSACQKSLPTALMVALTGCEDGERTYNVVCLGAQAKAGDLEVSREFTNGRYRTPLPHNNAYYQFV